MAESDTYCIDLLNQSQAVQSALKQSRYVGFGKSSADLCGRCHEFQKQRPINQRSYQSFQKEMNYWTIFLRGLRLEGFCLALQGGLLAATLATSAEEKRQDSRLVTHGHVSNK